MTRTGLLAMWIALLGLTLTAACGDDSSSGGGDGDSGDGDGVSNWEEEFPINLECPEGQPPADGEGAPHGACCFRGKPNSVRLEEQGDGELVEIAYRFNAVVPGNLYETLGAVPLPDMAIQEADDHESSILIKIEGPYEGGESVSGPGKVTIGNGVYNCDGTYSFYGDQAAPNAADLVGATYPGADDPGRYQPREVAMTVDAEQANTADRVQIAWEDSFKGFAYTSYVDNTVMPWGLDFELVTQNFTILDLPYDAEDPDCVGERNGDLWETAGSFAVYSSIETNNDVANTIDTLGGINMCTLLAFGVTVDPLDCATVERCEPGSADCKWKSLPDSLCPVTDDERANWACHVGAEDNLDGVEVNCTAEAPTGHPEDNDGQCCSRLGDDPDLPPCNAWRIVREVVAASANISDTPAQEFIDACPAE